jgi:cobalt-zinc-cadmium efflux system protein
LVPGKDMVTAHLASRENSARVLREAQTVLAHRGLDHATIQIELPDGVRECPPDC